MTTSEIIQYYADLLILQYIGKPRAYATIEALVKMVIMDQLPLEVESAFNIDTAVGNQLDTLGKYAGVTRSGYGFTSFITLDDDDFRQLIKVAIIKNTSFSDLGTIQTLLNQFFPGELFVFDFKNMRMGYFMADTVGSQDLAELFVKEGLLPKPMGVQLAALIYAPVIDSFFGFQTYLTEPYNNNPFNTYADYQMDWPWLSYQNGIPI